MRLALKCALVGYGAYWIFVEHHAKVVWNVQSLLVFNVLWMFLNGTPDWTIVFCMCESAIITLLFGCAVNSLLRVDSILFFLAMEQLLQREMYVGSLLFGFHVSRRNTSEPPNSSKGSEECTDAKSPKLSKGNEKCTDADFSRTESSPSGAFKDCNIANIPSAMSHCKIVHGIEERWCMERKRLVDLKCTAINKSQPNIDYQSEETIFEDPHCCQTHGTQVRADAPFHWYEIVACSVGMLASSYCSVLDWNQPWQFFPSPQMTALLTVKFVSFWLREVCALLNGGGATTIFTRAMKLNQ